MPLQNSNLALTVNINPQSFVSVYGIKKTRWNLLSNEIQTRHLDTILGTFDREHIKYKYAYELTKNCNVHLHVEILFEDLSCDDTIFLQSAIEATKNTFFSTLPRMPKEMMYRTWFVLPVYDSPGWEKYIYKEQKHHLKINNPDPDSDSPLALDSPTLVFPTKPIFKK